MKISPSQMEFLVAARRKDFIVRASSFVRKTYPAVASRAEPEELERLVDFAILRAGKYGFVSEREVIKYLTVMVDFGARFDEDERFSHLLLPLTGMGETSPSIRIARLRAMAAKMRTDDHAAR